MARLAAAAITHPGRQVRCRSSCLSDVAGLAGIRRFLPSQWTYSVRARPLNGGLPWPSGFQRPETKNNGFRTCGTCISTCLCSINLSARHSGIAASSQTFEFAAYGDKLFYSGFRIARAMC
jgi:hypothetical protein